MPRDNINRTLELEIPVGVGYGDVTIKSQSDLLNGEENDQPIYLNLPSPDSVHAGVWLTLAESKNLRKALGEAEKYAEGK